MAISFLKLSVSVNSRRFSWTISIGHLKSCLKILWNGIVLSGSGTTLFERILEFAFFRNISGKRDISDNWELTIKFNSKQTPKYDIFRVLYGIRLNISRNVQNGRLFRVLFNTFYTFPGMYRQESLLLNITRNVQVSLYISGNVRIRDLFVTYTPYHRDPSEKHMQLLQLDRATCSVTGVWY